jgi:cytochrome P450 family 135
MPTPPLPFTVKRRPDLPPAAPLPALVQTLACRLRPLRYLEWCRSRIGPRFTVNAVDMPPLVFLADPADIRAVTAAPLADLPPGAARVAGPLLGETAFMLRGEPEHRNGRAAVMPALHRRAAEERADMVDELARREAASWPLETPVPLYPRLCAITSTVMLRTVFAEDDDLTDALRRRMLAMLSVAPSLVLQEPRLRALPGWHAAWRRFTRTRGEVDRLIARLIDRRRPTQGRHGDMLDMLLDARRPDGQPMTGRELRDNLVSVIVAGHETTASSLAWAFQLIAHHPRVQDRLAAELDADPSEQYLAATVNETLRRRPVFLFAAPRAVLRPVEIAGRTYRPPALLLPCIYLLHHDPGLFPEPRGFRPERFIDSPERAKTLLPWGGGPQRCPGRHLALLELRTVIRAVLSIRRITPASGRIERASWRSAIVTPHAGSTVVLHAHAPRSRRTPTASRGAK